MQQHVHFSSLGNAGRAWSAVAIGPIVELIHQPFVSVASRTFERRC
jgi:hypothetical protein